MKRSHILAQIALVTCRCSCGWRYFNDELKGKSDEDLSAETYAVFESHVKGMNAS